jgi:thiosulfate/3-mercaptopyruvate sulfurtransferase
MPLQTLVTVPQLAERLDADDWRVVDCRFDLADTGRGERDFALGHIPGACYAHLDRDLSSPITADSGRHPLPDPQGLCSWFGAVGIGVDTQVVAYDDSAGTMAVRLWWLLRWLGHHTVALLDGGWQAWAAAGMAVESGPGRPRDAAIFAGQPDPTQVVATNQLAKQTHHQAAPLLVMDARTAERFRGESEPIDPVAGHIPGAINLPLQRNLNADGTFRSAAELRRLYRTAIGAHNPSQVAAMCGSGVTACHNLLAMEIAGLSGGKLYAGSWSEWIRDPRRPVATGA